jgi:hypothetical protein
LVSFTIILNFDRFVEEPLKEIVFYYVGDCYFTKSSAYDCSKTAITAKPYPKNRKQIFLAEEFVI